MPHPTARALSAGASYFGCVFGAGFILGMLRVPFLVPRVGVRAAELLEMPFMVVVIVVSAKFISRRFVLPPSFAYRFLVGCVALALGAAAELLVALVLVDENLSTYLANRDPVSGSVYLVVLGLFTVMPALLGIKEARKSKWQS